MKKVFLFLIFYSLLLFNGCLYTWTSNAEIEGIIVKEKYLEYEDIVTITDSINNNYTVRFQLAAEGKGGFDPDLLKSLRLIGRRCKVITGPHGVVLRAFLFDEGKLYEIPKK